MSTTPDGSLPCPLDSPCQEYYGGSHYHCGHCGEPGTSMLGHFVGGSRRDARVICDPEERRAYLAMIGKEET